MREVEKERVAKLRLEDGRIILPDPDGLVEGWEEFSQISMEKYGMKVSKLGAV